MYTPAINRRLLAAAAATALLGGAACAQMGTSESVTAAPLSNVDAKACAASSARTPCAVTGYDADQYGNEEG